MAPETSTAMNLYRYTLTPRVSAATGLSPHERSRSPNVVRHSTHQVKTTMAKAMSVTADTFVTSEPTMAARSETKKICLCSRLTNPDETPGMLMVGRVPREGDWVGPPPGVPVKVRAARYF